MPHDYIRRERRYRGPDGRLISRREVKRLIDNLTDFIRKDATRIASKFDAGSITAAEFASEMRGLLKSGHIVAASVGKGGRQRMTSSDWLRVGRKIKWQNGYLEKFARKLESGTLSRASTLNRARAYVNSVYISYAETFFDAQVEPIEPRGDQTKDENILVRLVTNSEEGCPECAADEDEGWMKPEDMTELGGRICGDFCRCTLEFSDELDTSGITE